MTKAVKREPGDILVVTRRCHLQWARFVPEEQVRAAFHVILDAAERRTGVRVVAFMAMSNHYHAVVEDVDCRFGRWASEVNAQLATFANVVQGLGSHAWDAKERSDQKVEGLSAVAEAIAYALVNPVRAGLVYSPSSWPGAMTHIEDIGTGRGRSYERPKAYFREKGPVPKVGELRSYTPACFEEGEFRAAVLEAYERQLAEARAEVKRSGRKYAGVERVLKQSVTRAPTKPTPRPPATPLRRHIAPTPEQAAIMLAEEREFRRLYEGCLAQLRAREREVVFPAGTYRLRVDYNLPCEARAAQEEAAQAAS